eukprot:TRINITY_DN28860_c0_g1_i1.p1 TRINITY_DN28860_c0_g1~~TRINITY_DN28860_c0_g1_i1.p1  ORF type:complete len:264 (+),score=40.57 TRINITY_DN28860_c0_g1_i1:109-792(+)
MPDAAAMMPHEHRARLAALPGNATCVDCGKDSPDWASLSHGTLVCLRCSGRHRALGVAVSFVRSVTMDAWSDEQLQRMALSGGNAAFTQWLTAHGVGHSDTYLRYLTPVAQLWRDRLSARCKGEPEPTELPAPPADLSRLTRALEGGGGEGVQDWAADGSHCQLCAVGFTMMYRRHHCRRCGRCVCSKCAPAANTRPIMEAGLRDPVRHCYKCFRSPLLDWSHVPPA